MALYHSGRDICDYSHIILVLNGRMESDIEHTHIHSDYFDKQKFQKQIEIIKKASEDAMQKIDYYSAHDDNIIRAIDIVEEFLRKKHRLCYGGQAINAHLPVKYRFYDPEFSIPDYDFFTPNQHADISSLVKDLKLAGFTEISAREGMHEGTIKIYVDYVPVADMTAIDPKLYRILSKKEFKLDGISYLDANSLRMLMYLELSRPRGEVSRWSKVFERLALFNEFLPVRPCRKTRKMFRGNLTKSQVETVVRYLIDNRRVFAGANLLDFYSHALKEGKQNKTWILDNKKPIIFYSPDANMDAKQLRADLEFLPTNKPITIRTLKSRGVDIIPSMKVIVSDNRLLVFIIDQTACHSYFNVPIDDGKVIRIASIDTLITLYFSLGLVDSEYFDMGSMECLANQLVQLSIQTRNQPEKFIFPFISIRCVGHQTSLPSLIRAKVKRITVKKRDIRGAMDI